MTRYDLVIKIRCPINCNMWKQDLIGMQLSVGVITINCNKYTVSFPCLPLPASPASASLPSLCLLPCPSVNGQTLQTDITGSEGSASFLSVIRQEMALNTIVMVVHRDVPVVRHTLYLFNE